MKRVMVSILTALCLASMLALASGVSAEEHAIQPGSSYTVEVTLSFPEMSSYSWSSDVALDFVINDPAGDVYLSVNDFLSHTGVIVGVAGTYTITWTNNEGSVAHLTYSVSGTLEEVEEGISALIWGIIIAAVIVVAIIVIVVIVVVMGGKKAPAQQPMGPQPQVAAQAMATGHCPTCGNLIDPNAMFCQRCGTRFR